jgi:hypothetical protein
MTILVDVPTTKAEVPVNYPDWTLQTQPGESGLFRGFAQGCFGGRFVALKVTFRKSPVVVGIPNEQILSGLAWHSTKDNPSSAHLQLGTTLTH